MSLFVFLCHHENKRAEVGKMAKHSRFVPKAKTFDSLKRVLVLFFELKSRGLEQCD